MARRRRGGAWVAGLLPALLLVGCGDADPPPARELPRAGADTPAAVPADLDTGLVRAPGVPDGAVRALVLHLFGFDEEGILSERLEVAGPGSYATGDVVWTDAGAVAALLARWDSVSAATPDTGGEEPPPWAAPYAPPPFDPRAGGGPAVAEAGGRLVVAGERTGILARTHAGVVYAPVAPLAARYGALFYLHEPPDAGVRHASGTLWPRPLLCVFGRRADPRAPIFMQAREEGLFAACDPDPSGRELEPGMS